MEIFVSYKNSVHLLSASCFLGSFVLRMQNLLQLLQVNLYIFRIYCGFQCCYLLLLNSLFALSPMFMFQSMCFISRVRKLYPVTVSSSDCVWFLCVSIQQFVLSCALSCSWVYLRMAVLLDGFQHISMSMRLFRSCLGSGLTDYYNSLVPFHKPFDVCVGN